MGEKERGSVRRKQRSDEITKKKCAKVKTNAHTLKHSHTHTSSNNRPIRYCERIFGGNTQKSAEHKNASCFFFFRNREGTMQHLDTCAYLTYLIILLLSYIPALPPGFVKINGASSNSINSLSYPTAGGKSTISAGRRCAGRSHLLIT